MPRWYFIMTFRKHNFLISSLSQFWHHPCTACSAVFRTSCKNIFLKLRAKVFQKMFCSFRVTFLKYQSFKKHYKGSILLAIKFGESGYRLELHLWGEYQSSVTLVKSNLDNDNSKSCLHLPWIPAQFEVIWISPCLLKNLINSLCQLGFLGILWSLWEPSRVPWFLRTNIQTNRLLIFITCETTFAIFFNHFSQNDNSCNDI